LKSTNEELQSTNEELQSTNEELTTSKEEMQSLNEELQTVNAELQSKVDDYSRVNNDMKNLLNSTDIATLFLDKELNIRRFTNQATKIFKLIKTDIGRPFTDLVSDLNYPDLAADSLEVLRTLIFIQKQIPAKDGRWFSVRIMPYRTFDDRIDGLVITFINISDLKQVEVQLQETEQLNSLLLDTSPDVIIKLTTGVKILEFNHAAEKFFGKKRSEVLNRDFIQFFVPGTAQKMSEKNMKKTIAKSGPNKITMQVISADLSVAVVEWSVNIMFDSQKKPSGMIMIIKK
jgi:two-component system CheB/CheR fusion protein